ncbi:hypothetical protein JDW19_22720 [Paenibacillus polymyxa]|uniref:Uncharacterized protein n=1 Tax=Paenibacillus polymyxa TaxID=1406 RepID=A0A8I1LWD1_PAEPO|nr:MULTISPECIES: hypothetical protein [Paenibacillus]KAF6570577.1 hypothetical protein G9G53_19980 [Paenibacillus sp. EKM206P]KAF6588037.1 hypothetical protein G9G52_16635 [Paenibacillus sp. EKM205P]MBM0635918.1 hypothetical protein [Paenibacillus polymyxa]
MWIVKQDFKKINEYESMYGRLLILCQKYEKTCKEIVKWLNLAVAIDERKFGFLSDEHMSYVEKLDKLFLAGSLNALDKNEKLNISDEDINLLQEEESLATGLFIVLQILCLIKYILQEIRALMQSYMI